MCVCVFIFIYLFINVCVRINYVYQSINRSIDLYSHITHAAILNLKNETIFHFIILLTKLLIIINTLHLLLMLL